MLLLFISAFIIITGIHEQRLAQAKDNKEVVYRYIPRSALDEQLYGTPASTHFLSMFADKETPWVLARPDKEERAIHARTKMFEKEPVKQIIDNNETIFRPLEIENFKDGLKQNKYPRNKKNVQTERKETFSYQDDTDDEYTSEEETYDESDSDKE
jgi:hypothetical protein